MTDGERADSRRARLRLISAAREAIAEQGLDVSGADIASRAEVGIGTLYRRFGSKDALIEAVVMDSVMQVTEAAHRALAGDDPGVAFETFLQELCHAMVESRGLTEMAARSGANQSPEVQEQLDSLRQALEQLTGRAQAAGAIRADVTWGDIAILARSTATTDACLGVSGGGQQWRRNFAILMDGLVPGGVREPAGPPPRALRSPERSA